MSEQNTNCTYRYTVKRGDSFYLIAQRQGVQLRDLLEANPDIPPARLTVGDVLCIPYAQGADQPAAEQENACAVPPCGKSGQSGGTDPSGSGNNASGNEGGSSESGNNASGSGQVTYVCPVNRRAVVQEGQTATDLQLRYNLSFRSLKLYNTPVDLDAIKGGDIVCIPSPNVPCDVPAAVTLGEGEDLQSIAARYQVSVTQLLRANPCLAPSDFKAGAVIRLPD